MAEARDPTGERVWECTGQEDYELPRLNRYECPPLDLNAVHLRVRSVDFPLRLVVRAFPRLRTLELPEGLRIITKRYLHGFKSLESVLIPSSVTEIDQEAFCGFANLKSVNLPQGLRSLGKGAFSRCHSLESIQLPPSLTEIGESAFENCNNLNSVVLPEGIPRIGQAAFQVCPSLGSMRLHFLSRRMEGIRFDPLTADKIARKVRQISSFARRGGERWTTTGRQRLEQLEGLVTYWELRQATAILELALWKAKIGEQEGRGEGTARLSRGECRVKCGADAVMNRVLSYFTYHKGWW